MRRDANAANQGSHQKLTRGRCCAFTVPPPPADGERNASCFLPGALPPAIHIMPFQGIGGCACIDFEICGRQALSDLLNAQAALTSDIGLRIEKAFGLKMEHLMRMQLAYDLAQARKDTRSVAVKRYVERIQA